MVPEETFHLGSLTRSQRPPQAILSHSPSEVVAAWTEIAHAEFSIEGVFDALGFGLGRPSDKDVVHVEGNNYARGSVSQHAGVRIDGFET